MVIGRNGVCVNACRYSPCTQCMWRVKGRSADQAGQSKGGKESKERTVGQTRGQTRGQRTRQTDRQGQTEGDRHAVLIPNATSREVRSSCTWYSPCTQCLCKEEAEVLMMQDSQPRKHNKHRDRRKDIRKDSEPDRQIDRQIDRKRQTRQPHPKLYLKGSVVNALH